MNKAAETAKIPCAVCRDLMPLVQDGVASPESEALVQAHMAVCPACRALWQGTDDPAMPELPALDDGKILQKLRRRFGGRDGLIDMKALCPAHLRHHDRRVRKQGATNQMSHNLHLSPFVVCSAFHNFYSNSCYSKQ